MVHELFESVSFDDDVASLADLIRSKAPLLRSRPDLRPRQLAAAGLMRSVALLVGIGVLRRAGRTDVTGILARQHFETFLVSLYLLFKGEPALEELRADDVYWSRRLSNHTEIPFAEHLAEWKGEPRALNYRDIAAALGPLLDAAGKDVGDGVMKSYNLIYRIQSQVSVHSGLHALQSYVDFGDSHSWGTSPNPAGTPGVAEGEEQVAAQYSAYLAHQVFEQFGIETLALEVVTTRIIGHQFGAADAPPRSAS